MSAGKAGSVSVTGSNAQATGVVAVASVAALAGAAALTFAAMKVAYDAAQETIEREKIAKRMMELEALQAELASGQEAAARFNENVAAWKVKTKCKVLGKRRDRNLERAHAAGVQLRGVLPLLSGLDSKALQSEVVRLESELAEQESALRKAIAAALEGHTAEQGVANAIDRLANLPVPLMETPGDILGYLEEAESFQKDRRNEAALKAFRKSVQDALQPLSDLVVPQSTLEGIARAVADFAKTKEESAASVERLKIVELVNGATSEARALEPLRKRVAKARELAADLVYHSLSAEDQGWLLDENSLPGEAKIAALERQLAEAKAKDAEKIREQQQRLVMAATLDALQNLGYTTSVMDETAWWEKGSMFISSPEWGGYVVRLTPQDDGSIRFFACRYVDDHGLDAMTPEMEAFYEQKIGDWCDVHLKRLVGALEARNIQLDIREVDEVCAADIQPVASDEVGVALQKSIKEHRGNQEKTLINKAKARSA